jgi:hypothetical protein
VAAKARARPSRPPKRESRRVSMRLWRMMRARLEPRARRVAISRWRVAARARRKLARLAQAMSRTRAVTTMRTLRASP